MTVNRTTLLDLPLPVTGTESGTWGDITNNGLTEYMDIAIAGMSNLTSANFTAGALTIETTEGNSAGTSITATSAQYAGFRVTSLAVNSTITVGNTGTSPARSYRLINADATYNLTFKATGQTGVTLLPGQSAVVAFNGTDYVIVGTVGAGTATDNAVARFDGTTGEILQNSVVTIADSTGDVAGVGALTMGGNLTLSGGTANGVLYLNGSKVATSGSAVTYNGTTFSTSADASVNGLTVGRGAGSVSSNTAVGSGALSNASTTGEYNTSLGRNTMPILTSGSDNVAVGNAALNVITQGSSNSALGNSAGSSLTTGSSNTFLGINSGRSTNTASNNTAVGASALYANTTGANNTAVGYQALTANTTASGNTAIGYQSLYSNTSGFYNTAVGSLALYSTSTGKENVAVGASVLYSNTTGARNTAMGTVVSGVYNAPLYANTTGSQNTAIGNSALGLNTTASDNTAVGYRALQSNTTGQDNTAVGSTALASNSTGSSNTGIGRALLSNTTGSNNVAMGLDALRNNTTASGNTATGYQSLYTNTTGANNTAMGYQSLYANTTGAQNTAVGLSSGGDITTGLGNTCIGYAAGQYGGNKLTTGSYNTMLGYGSIPSANTGSSEIVIAAPGSDTSTTGKGLNTGFISPNGGGVYQGNNSSSWSTTSDRRLKKNIVDNNEGLDVVSQIRVRNFEYRTAEEVTELPEHTVIKKEGIQLGVIAQELQEVCPDCVKEESTGVLSVDSDNVFWHMVNAIKQLKTELDSVKAELATLKGA